MSPFVIWALLGIVRKDKCEHWRGCDVVLCISAWSLSFRLPELTLYYKYDKQSCKCAGHHSTGRYTCVLNNSSFTSFFCINKKVNIHLALYVASIEIHFIRFDHSILICVDVAWYRGQVCTKSFCSSILWRPAFFQLALDILYAELLVRGCWEQRIWLSCHEVEFWEGASRKIAYHFVKYGGRKRQRASPWG